MSVNEPEVNQRIYEVMTQLQADLEEALKKIFEQAGSKIKPEKQEEVEKEIEGTKQLLERFKSRYAGTILGEASLEKSAIANSFINANQIVKSAS